MVALSAPHARPAMALEVEGLAVSYDVADALQVEQLQLRPGTITVLLGPNGSGKSTLLHTLAGLVAPRAGTIRGGGTPLVHTRAGLARWRTTVGLVMHDPDDQLFGTTVCEDVAFGPVNLGLSRAEVRDRVDVALASLDLEELHDTAPHALSHGQKLRTAIAGILAMHPPILLLDEPTSGLDTPSTAALEAVLLRLRDAGRTLLVATHDIESAWRTADAALVLQRGRVVASGPVSDVLGTEGACARSGVPTPVPVALCEALRASGLLDDGAPTPRRLDEVLRSLQVPRSAAVRP